MRVLCREAELILPHPTPPGLRPPSPSLSRNREREGEGRVGMGEGGENRTISGSPPGTPRPDLFPSSIRLCDNAVRVTEWTKTQRVAMTRVESRE